MSESSSPVSPDPWKDVADALRELPVHWVAPQMQAVRSAITAARAADALRHQQEIADIRSRHWREKLGLEASITCRDETNGRLHKKLEELRAALSTAEATIQQLAAEVMAAINEPMYAGTRQAWMDRAYAAEATITSLQTIVENTLWMAGRYADGRRTYAVGLYNDMLVRAEALGCAMGAKPAVDGMHPERLSLMEQFASLQTAELEQGAVIANLQAEVAQYDAMRESYMAAKNAEIASLRAERDAFKADVCAFSREQVQEAVNATLAAETERDAAQQEIAALRRALGDAFADRVVAALSSSPHPQEPQP